MLQSTNAIVADGPTRACSPTPLCGHKIRPILALVSARPLYRPISAARLMRRTLGRNVKAAMAARAMQIS